MACLYLLSAMSRNTVSVLPAGKQASGMVHPFMVQGATSSNPEERTPLLREPSNREIFETSETFEVIGDEDLCVNSSPPRSSTVADLISVNTLESSCDSFVHRSTTASMTNFIQFSDSSADVVSNNLPPGIDCTSAGTGAGTAGGTSAATGSDLTYLESTGTYNVTADIESSGDNVGRRVSFGHAASVSPVCEATSDTAAGDTISTILSPNTSNLATDWTEKVDTAGGTDAPYLTVDSRKAVSTSDLEVASGGKAQDFKSSDTSLI